MSCRILVLPRTAFRLHDRLPVSNKVRWAAVVLFFLGATPLQAATLNWDPNANGSLSDVSGNWDTLTGNWWNGAGDQAWINANNDTAQFGTGTGGVAPFTVTLTEPIQVGGLTFQNQNYTVAGSTLTWGGAAATVTTNANGTISSAIAGSAMLVKQGPGTLTLTGLNNSTGGATISQGMLSVMNLAGGNSLGSGLVTLNGGTLRLAGTATAPNLQQIIGVSGFNQDLVWGVAESTLSYTAATTAQVASWVWYEHGVVGSQGLPVDSGPAPRTFTSAANAAVQFQFAPYGTLATRNNNGLLLGAGANGTLTLATPGQFQALQFLTNTQGSGAGTTWNATLNFSDGSHTVESNLNDPDWTVSNSLNAINTGLYNGGVYSGGLFLREHDFALSAADQGKTLSSVTFNTVSSSGAGLVVFAMSALDVNTTPQTYSNSLSVTADSTIDIQSAPLASTGNFSIGGNKLSVTGIVGSNLTLGATTLSGNPTFDPAAGTTLTLGALGDGGTPRTITKSNTGALTLASAATSLVDGTQIHIAGGTLNSNQATALGNLAAVDVAAGSTLSIGASQTVGSLSNSGSVLLNGHALTVGSTNNLSATFAGTLSDGTAPGTLIKAGAGTLILTGPNAHTGGTVVSQGVLSVSRLLGVNSLGPAPVTLSGGTLRLGGQGTGPIQQQTVPLSGYSQDVIWGNGEAATAAGATTTDFVSWSWYEHGVPGTSQGLPANTGAAPRTFTSVFNPAVQFQFAGYGTNVARNNNVLIVGQGNSSTINIASPASFQTLNFLETCQGGGGTTWHATLNFSDSSQTVLASVTDPDWTADSSHNALTSTGLVPRAGGSPYTGTLDLREWDFSLSAADQLKTLTSVTFSTTSSPGGSGLAFFALSGQEFVTPTVGPTQTYANPVTVTADSTIDVQTSLAAAMGPLSIGGNKLSLTGASGASLAMGATTLTGNATFDPAAGTTLILPAVSDGGSGFGIIKTGPGTLTIAGVGNYSGITRVNAGTLNVTGALANADSAHVLIAVSPTAPTTFAADTPVVESLVVSATGSYAGHGSQIAGDLNTRADVIAGINSGAFTGGNATMTMQWRQRTSSEILLSQGGTPASPPLPSVNSPLISDVIKLAGMASGSADPTQTDPFVLQMTYDPSELSDEASRTAAGAVYLGWLNPTGGPGGVPLWQNAVAGDTGNNASFSEQNFQGDFATFQGAFGATLGNYIGAWGVDTAHHDVWAVVNHNSEFAVVPEPSTIVLLIIACAAALSIWRRQTVPVSRLACLRP